MREEVSIIRRAGTRGFRAPMRTLQLFHRTAHVLGVARAGTRREEAQLDLPLAPAAEPE